MIKRDKATGRILPTHGMKKHPLYDTWRNMVARCTNPDRWDYKYYGGRGIIIVDEWLDVKEFIRFAESSGWVKGLTIDRIRNDGNYEPSNCRFVDFTTQMRNTSRVKMTLDKAIEIRLNSEPRTYKHYDELATKYGVSSGTIQLIIRNKIWKERPDE